ncbi:unnamed protein product [Rotaria sordida]|uniref:Opioid growth factor receptor (OGFr) conserved domain-containing protein n=1 Tax=Rotaria sordida TaxID=392033 RepID=A0A815G3K5_9BILA|nr:unnamed protein product [Rotaria sordida]CAF1333879.1 unnamed protein product [Rotaria sordida]
MDHDDSCNAVQCIDGSGKDIKSSEKIPGGEKQNLPEEPTLSEGSTKPKMGCAPSKPKSAKKQKTTEEESTTKEKIGNAQQINKEQNKSKTNTNPTNRQISNASAHYMSDDDDNENNSNNKSFARITRSSLFSSKLSIRFDDSDEEENSSYTSWAQRDIAEYRNGYPDVRQYPQIKDNYKFYANKMPSFPHGDYIDNIHDKWFGDYHRLEIHHGYIQWLFPLQEKGLNFSAEPLQKHEIELIKNDMKALKRILTSYILMLDFYGFELVNEKTGEIRRLPNDNYKSRFRNLNTSSHNYLRITRILKCLGEFDYEHLKFPFLEQILRESITENTLPNCLRSCKDYWIETLKSRDERRAIRFYARELIDYQKKGIKPPQSHCAVRPTTSATKKPKQSPSKTMKQRNDSD